MNKLSSRLQVVADMVEDNSKIIDIGCDHGYLDIYLAKRSSDNRVIASDINVNALNSAKMNIKKANLDNVIDVRLGNGLDVVSKGEVDTIVISGMGSNTIVGILKYARNKLSSVDTIIIQSNNDLYFLRKNITSLGYFIYDEVLVKDKNIIYTVIKFKRGRKRYSYKELYLGPILMLKNDELFKEKNNREIVILNMIIGNIKKGHYFYRRRLKRNIDILNSLNRG